ncbi:hypothetical protein C1879_03155 [Paraeggerthella hongkongensis]|nr:hypothetical protein C1879_03155 [Paraeggerthella hongkongensis]
MFFGARVHDAKVAGAKGSNCCERQIQRSMGKGKSAMSHRMPLRRSCDADAEGRRVRAVRPFR